MPKLHVTGSTAVAPFQLCWTFQTLSRATSIPVSTLRDEVRAGRLAARRNGRRVLISTASFLDWFDTLVPALAYHQTPGRSSDADAAIPDLNPAARAARDYSEDQWDRDNEARCDHDHEHEPPEYEEESRYDDVQEAADIAVGFGFASERPA